MRPAQSIFVFILIAFTAIAHARGELGILNEEPLFGFEFTVTKPELRRKTMIEAIQAKFHKDVRDAALRLGASTARVEPSGINSLIIDNRQTITYDIDPRVIEITATPRTVRDYTNESELYDRLTFGAAASLNYFPHEIDGGGHVHIGRVFENNVQLLRDFTVDYFNHASLAIGIFTYAPLAARPLADLDAEHQMRYVHLIEEFDRDPTWSVETFARRMQTEVFDGRRESALNFMHLYKSGGHRTLEVRGLSPQKNFQQFLKIITLLRARLNHLRSHPSPLVRLNPGPRNFLQAVTEFHEFVEECQLPWVNYEEFGIASWRRAPFVIQRTPPPVCSGLLRMTGPLFSLSR